MYPPDASHVEGTQELDPNAPVSKVISLRTLTIVWIFLLAFAVLNYYSATVYLDGWNTFVSLFIAFCMGIVSTVYFMHLGFDRPINAFVFVASLAFVVLFVSFSISDSKAYQGQIFNGQAKSTAPLMHSQ